MNNSTLSEKPDSKGNEDIISVADDQSKTGKKETNKKSSDKHTLLLMTCMSLLIMLVAVLLIFFFIRNNPDLVHANDQSVHVSESQGFVNPNSIQQLEYDDENITLEAAPNSGIFVIFGVVFMVIMFVAFIFVKASERKEED